MMVRTGHDATRGAEARGAIRVACCRRAMMSGEGASWPVRRRWRFGEGGARGVWLGRFVGKTQAGTAPKVPGQRPPARRTRGAPGLGRPAFGGTGWRFGWSGC